MDDGEAGALLWTWLGTEGESGRSLRRLVTWGENRLGLSKPEADYKAKGRGSLKQEEVRKSEK